MPLFLLANWKLIGTGIAILAVFLSGWTVNGWRWQGKLETAVEAQKKADFELFEKEKKITEEINNDQEKRLSALDSKYRATLRRVQQYKECVPVTASSGKLATGGSGLPWAAGIEAGYLVDKSNNADINTNKLITCNKTLDAIYSH